ncbi:MAG: protein kinase [Acidobacteria bacterium]|nr:protein kinase [Acidobacteriota bacterium]
MAYEVGDRVGDYEIVSVLGAGGMGKVYKVKNTLSDRVEAMKVLLPSLTENADVMDRFLREIKVLGSLDHPAIAALRTAQRVDNQVVMIMEYIEGRPLDDLLHRGAMRREYGLSFIAQVLGALEYAHKRGIVHRDIKPSNMMVTATGQVKLMDFGIAKLSADRKLTATGSTLGSLYYMSPEQIQGADSVDARSDLYSLGICLYEVATGQRPFDAGSEYSLMSKHLNESPRPPIQLDPTIPDALNQIILMAIAKDPAQRFQSAAAMLAALNSVRKEMGFEVTDAAASGAAAAISTPPPPPSPTKPLQAMAPPPPPRPVQAPPAVVEQKSRRGLYIAVGSLATVGVLVAALLVIPKFLHTGAAGGGGSIPTQVANPPAQTTVVSPPTSQPAADSGSPPAAVTQPPAAGAASIPSSTAAQHATSPAPPKPVTTAQRPPIGGQAPFQQQPPAQSPPVTAPTPSSPPPQQQAAAPEADAGNDEDSPPPANASPARKAAFRASMNAVRESYNNLSIRAATAKSGLQGLQSQMGGMNLRADIRETATRVDYLMNEAQASLRAGQLKTAQQNIQMAERGVERLEKFLGR